MQVFQERIENLWAGTVTDTGGDLCLIRQVLQEGGKLLYDSYIERKSFSFAANAACEAMMYFDVFWRYKGTRLTAVRDYGSILLASQKVYSS